MVSHSSFLGSISCIELNSFSQEFFPGNSFFFSFFEVKQKCLTSYAGFET
ncbi:hypothetical protein LEP1GSC083_4498 [Leptospira interrogans serovar Pyrogenes str. L0374]|uniref:Uncharacterized protein n=1 Tax=Leptospira interrogans serovar Pyrogenes str. L0374 TaxID=1049928 RepID=M6KDF9_LEPIR|nr:hypothetical protein LEP1GSC083_4498 [Leptospira interrogans serovar Pyrogenes str. L0374]